MNRYQFFLSVLIMSSGLALGRTAPPFRAEMLNGKRVSLEQSLKPGRSLMVCFWASWCVPCLQELKEVTARLKEEPHLPLDLLTINVDTSETASDIGPTLKLYGFDFPVALDPKHEIFTKYQASKNLPFSTLINEKGEMVKTFSGFDEKMFDEVKKNLVKEASRDQKT